jgi:type I restriction enzyme M protein
MIAQRSKCSRNLPLQYMRNVDFGQHYTGSSVASVLTKLLDVRSPATVIDLGVGEGSLLMGANALWGNARLHGVDIDQTSLDLARQQLGKGTFGRADCLAAALPSNIRRLFSTADVVLCNPPFLELSHPFAKQNTTQDWRLTAEVKFLEISLELLRHGGSLGIILPDRYVSGPAYREFRKQLVSTCNVISVTHLPASTFKTAEVDAHFLVLRKELPVGAISLQSLGETGQLGVAIPLAIEFAEERMDFQYYSGLAHWTNNAVPLSLLLTQDVCRGVESRGRATAQNIFHTTDFKRHPDGLVSVPVHDIVHKTGLAIQGDILIPRVGLRSLHHCAQVTQGAFTYSDCVFRLRVVPEWQAYVFKYLRSTAGVEIRKLSAHGSCVKILGKQTLLDLPVPMVAPSQLENL